MMVNAKEPLEQLARTCSLPAALEVMGERWAFMILRAAFIGLRHFEEFQSALGIARNILASRLGKLVDNGILTRVPLEADRRKIEYRLTPKGQALLPTLVALRQWGETYERAAPVCKLLVDKRDLQPIRQVSILSHDGRTLDLADLMWVRIADPDPDPEAAASEPGADTVDAVAARNYAE